jgi:hypothetical protein
VLRGEFAKYEKEVVALDLGSASFGASDEDSDFDGFVVLTDAVWNEIGENLNQTLSDLPSWRCGSQEVRFFVGRYGNFGFGDFFIDHSLDRWYELPLSTHWHVQHYCRYYDPKWDFYRFQEEISEAPVQYLQHRAAGHFFQLFSHRRVLEKALFDDDKVSFYTNLGEAFFHSMCLPFFAHWETTPLWRWLFWVLKKSKSSMISELVEQLYRLSTSKGPDETVGLFREYQDEVARIYRNLGLLPSSWLSAPVEIPPEHQDPRLPPRLQGQPHPSLPSPKAFGEEKGGEVHSKPGESLEMQQRCELWTSWYKLSSLLFWFSKVIKRKDFCAGHIATGRALANAENITKNLSKPFGEEITFYVAESASEIERSWDWEKRQKILTRLQNDTAECLKKSGRISIHYVENPIALMGENINLSD